MDEINVCHKCRHDTWIHSLDYLWWTIKCEPTSWNVFSKSLGCQFITNIYSGSFEVTQDYHLLLWNWCQKVLKYWVEYNNDWWSIILEELVLDLKEFSLYFRGLCYSHIWDVSACECPPQWARALFRMTKTCWGFPWDLKLLHYENILATELAHKTNRSRWLQEFRHPKIH